jgi:uncharacterized damage-inducible protein DinB
MTGEPLAILVNFDRWASQRLFDACRSLSDAQLDQSFEIGLGSLRRTFVHIVSNAEYWHDRAIGRDPPRFDSTPSLSLDAIIDRHAQISAQLLELVSEHDQAFLHAPITSEFREPGETFVIRFTRSAVLLHLLNHGTHHRAQCLNMLRHLGISPLPEIDLIDSCQELVEHRKS